MATRFYLGSTAAPGIAPAFSASWDLTTFAGRLGLITTPGAGSNAQSLAGTGSANTNRLWTQFISTALSAQTISGNVKGQIQALETNLTDDYCPQLIIRVFSSDGLTERGVLLAADNSALSNEFALVTTNAKFPRGYVSPGPALTNVVAQANDVLVVEVGFLQFSTSVANARRTYNSSAGAAADLPEDESDTTALRTWIEFSQTLSFGVAAAGGAGPTKQLKRPRRILMPDGHIVYPQNEDERRRIIAEIFSKIAKEVQQESAVFGPVVRTPNIGEMLAHLAEEAVLKDELEFKEFRRQLQLKMQMIAANEHTLEAKRREIEEDDAEILKWLRSRGP